MAGLRLGGDVVRDVGLWRLGRGGTEAGPPSRTLAWPCPHIISCKHKFISTPYHFLQLLFVPLAVLPHDLGVLDGHSPLSILRNNWSGESVSVWLVYKTLRGSWSWICNSTDQKTRGRGGRCCGEKQLLEISHSSTDTQEIMPANLMECFFWYYKHFHTIRLLTSQCRGQPGTGQAFRT